MELDSFILGQAAGAAIIIITALLTWFMFRLVYSDAQRDEAKLKTAEIGDISNIFMEILTTGAKFKEESGTVKDLEDLPTD
jgi:uncharacterized membrane protein YqiK